MSTGLLTLCLALWTVLLTTSSTDISAMVKGVSILESSPLKLKDGGLAGSRFMEVELLSTTEGLWETRESTAEVVRFLWVLSKTTWLETAVVVVVEDPRVVGRVSNTEACRVESLTSSSHRNSVYGIICDDSCDDVIALYKS